MELTKEFLLERLKQFRAKVKILKEDVIRYETAADYTEELIAVLEKPVVETDQIKVVEVPVETQS